MRLTKTAIDRATATKADLWLSDPELPGFGVRVQLSGRKTFVLRYRLANAKQKKVTIGNTAALTIEQARSVAREKLALLARGQDPSRANFTALTMQALFDRYMDEHVLAYNKLSTRDRVLSWWKLLEPTFGSKLVTQVKRSDVLAFHAKMRTKKASANKCVSVLSKMFNLANQWEWITDGSNPARRIQKYQEQGRSRYLSKEEVAHLIAALDAGTGALSMARLIRLLLLTGCRVSEIAKARTEWVDWDKRLLRLPDSKSGPKDVPLSAKALALIAEAKGEWIIPSVIGGPLRDPQECWRKLRKHVGLEDVHLHDLRHTVGSHAHMAGLTQREIADLLGHKQIATTARYIHGSGSRGSEHAEKVAEIMGL